MESFDAVEVAAEVVASFVGHNSVQMGELPGLIQAVHAAVARLAGGVESTTLKEAKAEPKAPAVSIRKSVTPDYLVCLDDGKKFKSLRRHLAALGMTPEQYREKWNLPQNYPMIAPNYAAKRSELAKKIGLGQKRKGPSSPKRGTRTKPVNA